MRNLVPVETLQEMMTYYKERAHEYDEWFYRQGRYDRGSEANRRWFAEVGEVVAALEALELKGDVLELAPGTGIWTKRLARKAATVTAVDASAEMIEINRTKVQSERVSYIQADLFAWRPKRAYDAVFFGFWISHVPLERMDRFLGAVAGMLHPGAKIFFVDSRRESSGTAENQELPEQDQQIMVRKLNDGRAFEIVKNFYEPADLAALCSRSGFEVTVCETATYFLYAHGTRR